MMTITKLKKIFNLLFSEFGPRGWWPTTKDDLYPQYLGGPINDKERFEVMIGTILTQNTTWKNVEKAIINLNKHNLINPNKILTITDKRLAEIIRPSGYYNQKAKKLKELSNFILKNPIGVLKKQELSDLRKILLKIHGVGNETADSILLYALDKPIPIVDTYTLRIFKRIGLINTKDYMECQRYQEKNFPKDSYKLQELHALLVELAKLYCKKSGPDCMMCPLFDECKRII